MVAAITCTITPPADCLARLAACPALPRGERLEWAQGLDRSHHWAFYAARSLTGPHPRIPDRKLMADRWRSMARPLRVARERLREARREVVRLEDKLADLDIGSDYYEELP